MGWQHPAFVAAAVSVTLAANAARPLFSQLPKDPCAGATQSQVSAALGTPVGPGQEINSLHTSCLWRATSAKAVSLTVQYMVADTYERLRNRQLPGLVKNAVAGVGDEAFSQTVSASNAAMTMLFVRKGKTMLIVRVYGVPDAARELAAEKAVAAAAVRQL